MHINEFSKVIPRMYPYSGTSGSQGSMHYPIKIIRDGDQNRPDVKISKDNTAAPQSYYVDAIADVKGIRSLSTTLRNTGYYELKCDPENVDEKLLQDLAYRVESFKGFVGNGDVRLPLYKDSNGSIRFAARVFEFYSGKNKDKETMEIYVNEVSEGISSMRKIRVDSSEYTNHTGKIRIIGTFNTITSANGYIKLVFTARMLIIAASDKQIIGGLPSSRQSAPSGVSADEWADLVDTLKEYVNSGIPVHMVKSSIAEVIDGKIKLASSDNTYQAMVGGQQGKSSQAQHTSSPYVPQQFQTPQLPQQFQTHQMSQQFQTPQQQMPQQFQTPQQQYQPQGSYQPQGVYQPQQQFQVPQQFQAPAYPQMNVGKAAPQYSRR